MHSWSNRCPAHCSATHKLPVRYVTAFNNPFKTTGYAVQSTLSLIKGYTTSTSGVAVAIDA